MLRCEGQLYCVDESNLALESRIYLEAYLPQGSLIYIPHHDQLTHLQQELHEVRGELN
jgi:hypothetical protein